MRILKRTIAFALILAFFISSTGFTQLVYAAAEENTLMVHNQFVSYVVDKNTGRFGISTVEGAPRSSGDQDAPLLFEGSKPDTSFTTFRIDGEDYIFGNSYGFLGIKGGMVKAPKTDQMVNTSLWTLGDLEVEQRLTLVSDSGNPDLGNVRVTYRVSNKGKTEKSVGSRLLFDTKLGSNDGSPIIIPGIDKPVEHEISLEGEEVPAFWQSADADISPSVVSYGLISGWENETPDRMTVAHWGGIGSTKWNYQPDSTVKFTSPFNKHNKSDSAVALYWDPEVLAPGETRVYETFYGLGVFATADGHTFMANMSGPDSLELKEDKTGYIQEEFEISLSLDNGLPVSVPMENVRAVLELSGGLELAPGQSKEINLGLLQRDSRANLVWKVKGVFAETYRIGQATVYLHSDSLYEPQAYGRYVILPGSSGKVPDIQYTGITPQNLYYEDSRKSFNINGTGFGLMKDRSRWELKLIKEGQNPRVYNINHKQINLAGDTTIQVTLGDMLRDISDAGTYTVKLEHKDFQGCSFEKGLNISTDNQYMSRKYGILAVSDEGNKTYKIKVFNNEGDLKKQPDSVKNKLLLIVRGDIQQKEAGIYEAYSRTETPVEMNEVLLYNSTTPISISESNGSVKLAGNGGLSVSGSITFWKWDFEINLKKGSQYTLKPPDDGDLVNKKIERALTGAAGGLQNILAGFNLKFNTAYFYKDTDGNGLIFGGSMKLSLSGGGDEDENNNNNNNDNIITNEDKKDEKKDPFKIEAKVDTVAMGQKPDNTIGFKGIAAQATVGFPKDFFPPPVDIGAEATLKVDTFSDPGEVGLALDVDLKVIKVNGEIEFILKPYPFPDKLYLYVGTDVGVDIIPAIPVATLYGVGGGIDNISNLVNWDSSAPPLTIMLTASAEIGRILKMDKVTLSVSWQHAELKGNIGIKGYDIIKNATLRLRWYNPIGFHASATIEAFSCIEGKVLLNIYKDSFIGMASIRLFVPNGVPVVGGLTIAGAEAGIDTEKLWGKLTVIGVTMGVTYLFGEEKVEFDVGQNGKLPEGLIASLDGAEGLYAINYRDEGTGEVGRMIFGTNMKLVGSSRQPERVYAKDSIYLAAAGEDRRFLFMDMPVVTALDDTTYRLNVQSREAALFEIEYEGTKPNVRVYRPDGTEYMLVEDDINGNMRYQTIPAKDSDSGRDEQKLWISVVGPQPGMWTIVSDKPLTAAQLYDIKMAPEYTSLDAEKIGTGSVKVDWSGKYLDGAKVNLYLLEEGSSEAGRLLVQDIDAAAGTYTVTLPEDVMTGSYVIRAELSKEDYGYTSRTTGPFTVTDLKAPSKPRNLKVTAAGNGCLKVEWEEGTEVRYPAQGYILTVLNDDGSSVQGYPESYVSGRTEAIIGGEVTQQDGTTLRLETGKSYKISAIAHREEDLVEGEDIPRQHYSEAILSDTVFLPAPHPPALKLSLAREGSMLPLNTAESGIDEYYSTGKEAMLSVEADTAVGANIVLNKETVYSFNPAVRHLQQLALNEGENMVEIRAENSSGDFTDKVIRIICDTIPPLLLINSTEVTQSNGAASALIKGKCEPGSKLTINGGNVLSDENGLFEYTLDMGDNMSMEIFAVAEDPIGNISEYSGTVYNDRLKDIQRVAITPGGATVELGESLELSLNAIDSEGKHLSIKPELVKWSLMADTGTAVLENGARIKALKPGKAYIMAEYKVTEDYSHTDAVVVNVVESMGNKPITASRRSSSPAGVLERIIEAEKGKKDIYTARLQPGTETKLTADDDLTLDIPAGFAVNSADINISRYDNQEELMKKFPGMKLLSPVYDISLNKGASTGTPVSVSFRYEADQAADLRRIAVYRLDEQQGGWDYIGGTPDKEKGIITVRLSSFSKYAVLENSSLRLLDDVDDARWSRDVIYSLVHMNIVEGIKVGEKYYYMPGNYITRAEFIKLLSAGLEAGDTEADSVQLPFADKKEIPDWALSHIKAAYANGWVNGRIAGDKRLFGPKEQITREEACAILGRMLGDGIKPKRVYFTDRNQVAKYAINYLDILADMGVLSGYGDDTFRPKNFITREEAAAMIDKYLKNAS
ncbi:MAG: S-layer homology domain-containing protein [Clostridiaceae bacterium]|nr:S-layer homology domain-containing protein [Clostridiaceae bacterium]